MSLAITISLAIWLVPAATLAAFNRDAVKITSGESANAWRARAARMVGNLTAAFMIIFWPVTLAVALARATARGEHFNGKIGFEFRRPGRK